MAEWAAKKLCLKKELLEREGGFKKTSTTIAKEGSHSLLLEQPLCRGGRCGRHPKNESLARTVLGLRREFLGTVSINA